MILRSIPLRIRRVLVADDQEDMATGLRLILEMWGFEVSVAHDGREALAAARAVFPQAALLDLGLPKLDGMQVAREMRNDPTLARSLLLALTGYGDNRHRQLARGAGFDHHLVKPIDLRKLRAALLPCGAF
jgi:DNA-binding response OmpR family regulator